MPQRLERAGIEFEYEPEVVSITFGHHFLRSVRSQRGSHVNRKSSAQFLKTGRQRGAKTESQTNPPLSPSLGRTSVNILRVLMVDSMASGSVEHLAVPAVREVACRAHEWWFG
jgi:hypothetical protein